MTTDPSSTPPDSPQSSGAMLEQARRNKLRRLQELGVDPWGRRFDDHKSIAAVRSLADQIRYVQADGGGTHTPPAADQDTFRAWRAALPAGDFVGPKVRIAGRILSQRDKGKLLFLDVRDWSGRVQVFVGRGQVGEENWAVAECFDLGDLVGVDGELRYTKVGELTIFAEKLHFLGKSIETPPEKWHGLTDAETRQRMRYVDLAYNEGVLERFLRRTRIVQSIRRTLAGESFVEIEGPTLHTIAGGAAARPFNTHHNALDMPLVLRIALELHLKRMLVGGVERVYELGRVYRNEGVSVRHNPEFTMLEAYQAYGDYFSMMDLTEKIICQAIEATGQPTKLSWNGKTVDFTPPFARRTYDDLFTEYAACDPYDAAAITRKAEALGLATNGRHPDVLKSEIFEMTVEDKLVGPIFVYDYPASLCPLTKRKNGRPEIAERFEMYVHGMELANAYTELNDPDLQEALFKTQLAGMSAEESMARMDHDFIKALRYGMPPAGGLGIGIDRLVMLLTDSPSIRDVILFPLLRHAQEGPAT